MKNTTPDLVGRRFGLLVVTKREGSLKWRALWRCRCDCGREALRTTGKLRGGRTTSCCCRVGGATHAHTRNSRSPTYRSWQSMIARCTQPSNPAYVYYKKRGITVCE